MPDTNKERGHDNVKEPVLPEGFVNNGNDLPFFGESGHKGEEFYNVDGVVLICQTVKVVPNYGPSQRQFDIIRSQPMGSITGTIANCRPNRVGSIVVTFKVYDSRGGVVGETSAILSAGLAHKEMWNFKTYPYLDHLWETAKVAELKWHPAN